MVKISIEKYCERCGCLLSDSEMKYCKSCNRKIEKENNKKEYEEKKEKAKQLWKEEKLKRKQARREWWENLQEENINSKELLWGIVFLLSLLYLFIGNIIDPYGLGLFLSVYLAWISGIIFFILLFKRSPLFGASALILLIIILGLYKLYIDWDLITNCQRVQYGWVCFLS